MLGYLITVFIHTTKGNSDHDRPSSATEIYVHKLIIYQAITPCKHTLKTFVLQDYLEKSSSEGLTYL